VWTADAIDRYRARRSDCAKIVSTPWPTEVVPIDRKCPVIIDLRARRFLRAGGAALDETGNAETVIAAINQSAAELCLLVPADFFEALLEGSSVFAAVVLVLGVGRLHMRNRVGLLGLRDEIAPAKFQAVDAEISGTMSISRSRKKFDSKRPGPR
jgi:hypothetical protein